MRTRAVVLSVVVAMVVVGAAVVVTVGERQADDAMAGVRARAAATTVSGDDLLGAMFAADDDRIARRLGVDPAAVALSSAGTTRWCVRVTIRRMAAVREASFTAQPGEVLTPSHAC